MQTRRPHRRNLMAHARYLWTLLKRFKTTFGLLAFVQLGGSLLLWLGMRGTPGAISFTKAMGEIYFLMQGEPTFDLPDSPGMMLLTVVIPPLGIATIADGLVRFAYLFFAKHRNDKEWITVLAETYTDHVVLCGAGRVGYRILDQLLRLDVDVVVIEKNEQAPFVQTIRDAGVPLLIDDVRSDNALNATNIGRARAIVCATDDDLANLNIALDARRLNPAIHVV
ncbi:MAG: potassium channel family protein, partial [Myxococcales bacterium]